MGYNYLALRVISAFGAQVLICIFIKIYLDGELQAGLRCPWVHFTSREIYFASHTFPDIGSPVLTLLWKQKCPNIRISNRSFSNPHGPSRMCTSMDIMMSASDVVKQHESTTCLIEYPSEKRVRMLLRKTILWAFSRRSSKPCSEIYMNGKKPVTKYEVLLLGVPNNKVHGAHHVGLMNLAIRGVTKA